MKLSKVYQHRGAVYAAAYNTGSPNEIRSEIELCKEIFKNKVEADTFVKVHKNRFNKLRTVQLNLA